MDPQVVFLWNFDLDNFKKAYSFTSLPSCCFKSPKSSGSPRFYSQSQFGKCCNGSWWCDQFFISPRCILLEWLPESVFCHNSTSIFGRCIQKASGASNSNISIGPWKTTTRYVSMPYFGMKWVKECLIQLPWMKTLLEITNQMWNIEGRRFIKNFNLLNIRHIGCLERLNLLYLNWLRCMPAKWNVLKNTCLEHVWAKLTMQ